MQGSALMPSSRADHSSNPPRMPTRHSFHLRLRATNRRLRWAIPTLAVALPCFELIAQGSLTPPPGPPSPVMRTLDQLDAKLEKRIPIGSDTTPGDETSVFRITQPGSYYLAGNVTGTTGKFGIMVSVAGVTLDLNGFEVVGVPGAMSGIAAPASAARLVVRHGTIRAWPHNGINAPSRDSRFEHLVLAGNGSDGLYSHDATAIDCIARDNDGVGVAMGGASMATRVLAMGNRLGIVAQQVVDCIARENAQDGIAGAETVSGSQAVSNGLDGFVDCRIMRSCVARSNLQDGIAPQAFGQVIDCVADRNARHGIRLRGGTRAHGNSCTQNGHSGFGHGLHVEGNSNTAVGNSCADNRRGMTVTGLLNKIDDNTFLNNGSIGLFVTGQLNLIVRNSGRNPGGVNWNIAAGNRGGVFLGPAQNAAINGASGGPGSGTTDPFANLSF